MGKKASPALAGLSRNDRSTPVRRCRAERPGSQASRSANPVRTSRSSRRKAQRHKKSLILETAGNAIQSRRRRCKLSLASISNQVNHALAKVTWNKEQIAEYQAEQGVTSVKKSLRPGGDPTQPLPVILGISTRRTYFQAATLFFKCAEEIADEGLLANLLDQDIIMTTFEEHYSDAAPGTANKLLAALEKVHLGCTKLGWTKEPCPITPELRDWVKAFRDDSDVRSPRFGYRPEDAERVVSHLKAKKSVYALPAELALRCGLREDEIAGLKGENIDVEHKLLHITGKGGRYRPVPIPDDLLSQLNHSKQYLFTPSASWRAGFRRTVRDATKALGIEISGVHRLRANFAQNKYQDFLAQGMDEREARKCVSVLLGHARIDVTYKYVPKGFSPATISE
ncbi:site-specific recombinase XerD [Levilinea saccharolytica]|nr:site-specific recombinase XerD [Levilinea saccharolytica]